MLRLGFLSRILKPKRADLEELIDSGDLSTADFAQSFADIRHINRFLGGTSVIRKEMHRLASPAESTTMLDLGTGTADIPRSMIRDFRSKGGRLRAVGLDANKTIIGIALQDACHEPDLRLIAGDASMLPFEDASFDFVTCSLTFHHFSDSLALDTLREMYRVARRALIINDLRRAYLPAGLIWLVTRLTRMHRVTCHDGPVSVMRSRTLGEYRQLAMCAGFSHFQVRAHPFWRVALVVCKEAR